MTLTCTILIFFIHAFRISVVMLPRECHCDLDGTASCGANILKGNSNRCPEIKRWLYWTNHTDFVMQRGVWVVSPQVETCGMALIWVFWCCEGQRGGIIYYDGKFGANYYWSVPQLPSGSRITLNKFYPGDAPLCNGYKLCFHKTVNTKKRKLKKRIESHRCSTRTRLTEFCEYEQSEITSDE